MFSFLSSKLFSISTSVISNPSLQTPGIPSRWSAGFQLPGSPIFEGIQAFHDDLMVFLSFILGFVLYILFACISMFKQVDANEPSNKLTHAAVLEIIWTVIPALILILIAIPSFSLLYSIDEIVEPFLTIKAIGHQWYWSYEYLNTKVIAALYNPLIKASGSDVELLASDSDASNFDSYMLGNKEVMDRLKTKRPEYRLLSVDHTMDVPARLVSRVLITSADVIHSWAVPSLGIKLDSCPGRLNQTSILVRYLGRYFGQCSELCGVNHGFMPICVNSISVFRVKGITDIEILFAFAVAEAHGRV